MTQVMVRMPYELLDRLAKHAYRTKADRSTVIRAALDEFLPR
jgi:metal-responsive CopG/Arc/MetJ family transcriptional regulator